MVAFRRAVRTFLFGGIKLNVAVPGSPAPSILPSVVWERVGGAVRIMVWVIGACAGSIEACAADYSIDISRSDPDAASTDLKKALDAAFAHRRASPGDKIFIELPRLVRLAAPIHLEPSADGSEAVVLRGKENMPTSLDGGVDIELAEPTSEQKIMLAKALGKQVIDRIRVASLSHIAKAVTPTILPRDTFSVGSARLSIFEQSHRLLPSRWPAIGFQKSARIKSEANAGIVSLDLSQQFSKLDAEPFIWLGGYWKRNWWYEISRVLSLSDGNVRFATPKSGVGPSPRFVLLNALAGLETEGRYVVDSQGGVVYVNPLDPASTSVNIPIAESALSIEKVRGVEIRNVVIQHTIGPAVLVREADNVTLRNVFVGHVGSGHGIEITGSTNSAILDSVIADVGEIGVILDGGDRRNLTPGGNRIVGSLITSFGQAFSTYRPGVRLSGVQNSIEDCEIANGDHAGIILSGNDHLIERNNIHDLVLDTSDAGAIYAGRDWTSRGNRVRLNWIHDVKNNVDQASVVGVYLDDGFSGTLISDNFFQSVQTSILIGGGRDNRILNNVFVNFERAAIAFDARGLNWLKDMVVSGALRQSLDRVPYRSTDYSQKYPELVTILANNPGAPLNNIFVGNKAIGGSLLEFATPDAAQYPVLQDNIERRSSNKSAALEGTETTARELGIFEEWQRTKSQMAHQQLELGALREKFRASAGNF